MKLINNKILTLILSTVAIFVMSGCGSSGTSSDNQLAGGEPVTPPTVEGKPQVTTSYEITAYHESTVVVHAHMNPSSTGDVHTHAWTQISGPTVALSTTMAPTTTFVTPVNVTQPIILQHTVTNTQTGLTTVTPHIINPIAVTNKLDVKVSKAVTLESGAAGSLHASASGGDGLYTYAWTQTAGTAVSLDTTHPSAPMFTAPTVSSAETLTFEVVVIDGSGALVAITEKITVIPKVPALHVSALVASLIYEGTEGTLHAQASGGKAPYTYKWLNTANANGSIKDVKLQTTQFKADYIDNSAGLDKVHAAFSVTVTDANGATVTTTPQSMTIYDVPLSIDIIGATTRNAGEDVHLGASVTGGDGVNYSYEWLSPDPLDPLVTTQDLYISGYQTSSWGGTTKVYKLTVKNTVNGVTETKTEDVYIIINAVAQALQVTAIVPSDMDEGKQVSLEARVSGGTAPYTYQWTNIANTNGSINDAKLQNPMFTADYIDNTGGSTGLPAIFTVTVTDATGATVTSAQQDMTIHDVPLSVTFTGSTTVNAGDAVHVIAVGLGGDGIYIYEWYDVDPFNPAFTGPDLTILGTQTGALPPGTVLNYNLKVKNTINGVTETHEEVVSITIN